MSQQTKSEMLSNEGDRSNFNIDARLNQNIPDASKKQKGKPGLQLNMNHSQDAGILKVRDSIEAICLLIVFKKATAKDS